MAHKNLIRSIKKILDDCPASVARLTFEPSTRSSSRGEISYYEITEKGLLLLLSRLSNKKSREIAWVIISNLVDREKALKEKLNARKQKRFGYNAPALSGEMEKNNYGTRWRPKVAMKDKKILVVPEAVALLDLEEGGYCDANDLTKAQLMQCIISLDESKISGIKRVLSKKELYLAALQAWEAGLQEEPNFKAYGFKTEYDCFFES